MGWSQLGEKNPTAPCKNKDLILTYKSPEPKYS